MCFQKFTISAPWCLAAKPAQWVRIEDARYLGTFCCYAADNFRVLWVLRYCRDRFFPVKMLEKSLSVAAFQFGQDELIRGAGYVVLSNTRAPGCKYAEFFGCGQYERNVWIAALLTVLEQYQYRHRATR
jgi:hypothetical protein